MPDNQNESSSSDRRAHPRVAVNFSKTVHISELDICPIRDVSLGGLSFLSTTSCKVDELLQINFGNNLFQLDAVVLDCHMVETDAALMEYKYLTRCQFKESVLQSFLANYIASLEKPRD